METSLPTLGEIQLSRELLHSCGDLITRHRAVPLEVRGTRLLLGLLDLGNQIACDDFHLITGFDIDPVEISAFDFSRVEEHLRLDPPEVFSMVDFPEEAYRTESPESASTAEYVLSWAGNTGPSE